MSPLSLTRLPKFNFARAKPTHFEKVKRPEGFTEPDFSGRTKPSGRFIHDVITTLKR
jgi:hypothetical protein